MNVHPLVMSLPGPAQDRKCLPSAATTSCSTACPPLCTSPHPHPVPLLHPHHCVSSHCPHACLPPGSNVWMCCASSKPGSHGLGWLAECVAVGTQRKRRHQPTSTEHASWRPDLPPLPAIWSLPPRDTSPHLIQTPPCTSSGVVFHSVIRFLLN